MSEFLDRFIQNTNHKVDPDSKFVFEHDKWDRQVADKLYKEIVDYRMAIKDLKGITPTGFEAMVDSLYSLFKANPVLRPSHEIRPSYLIDHTIMDILTGLKEYEKFRPTSKGDPVNAGLAAVDLEPTLEKLFDQMPDAVEASKAIEGMLEQGDELTDAIEAMMQAAANAEDSSESEEYKEQAAAMQEQLEALADSIEQKTQDLNELLEIATPSIEETLQEALKEMNEKADAQNAFMSWGLNQGTLAKIDPAARIELSKKLGSEKFRKMADIIGKMQTLAIQQQQTKLEYMPEEVYDIEQGDALHRMLPAEALALCEDITELDWMRRLTDKEIRQYALRGNQTVDRGSILLLEDGSGSMMMNNGYIWAKAIALALLKIAFMQKRGFFGVQFGGPRQYCTFDFDTESSILGLTIQHGEQSLSYEGVQALVEYADKFINDGGTDFMTPLSVGLERLSREFEEKGCTEADIVFVTDGYCDVTAPFLEKLKEEQERLGFNIYGVNIGYDRTQEPMFTICDGKVISLKELTDSKTASLAPLFQQI